MLSSGNGSRDDDNPFVNSLQCVVTATTSQDGEHTADAVLFKLPVHPDGDKKSSYTLDTQLVLEPQDIVHITVSSVDSLVMYVGGFQWYTSARSVEVSLRKTFDGPFEYLTTCRGLPGQPYPSSINRSIGIAQDNAERYNKAMCVIPGGPKPVYALRCTIKSVKADGVQLQPIHIGTLKITARLGQVAPMNSPLIPTNINMDATVSSIRVQPATQHSNSEPVSSTHPTEPNISSSSALTREDLGAAMASFSFLLRQSEDRILQALQKQEIERQESWKQFMYTWKRYSQEQQLQQQILWEKQGSTIQSLHKEIRKLRQEVQLLHSQQEQSQPRPPSETSLSKIDDETAVPIPVPVRRSESIEHQPSPVQLPVAISPQVRLMVESDKNLINGSVHHQLDSPSEESRVKEIPLSSIIQDLSEDIRNGKQLSIQVVSSSQKFNVGTLDKTDEAFHDGRYGVSCDSESPVRRSGALSDQVSTKNKTEHNLFHDFQEQNLCRDSQEQSHYESAQSSIS